MSFLKTIKGQAIESDASIADWPNDGMVKAFFPIDEVFVGPGLGDITEVISESTVVGNAILTNCDGVTCADFAMLAAHTMATNGAIGTMSFVGFLCSDTPTNQDSLVIGDGSHKVASSSAADTSCFIQMGGAGQFLSGAGGTGVELPDAQADALQLIVVDRENQKCEYYAGTDGETLYGTIDFTVANEITPTTVFTFSGKILIKSAANSFGCGVLAFPKGIPDNLHTVMQYINTELRAGRKYNWLNRWVDMLEYS